MMSKRLVFAALIAPMLAMPALAQDKPPIIARAEACLRSNVDRVVAADPDVNSAANFLLNFSCAGEVSDATRYETNLVMVKSIGAMGAGMGQFNSDKGGPSIGTTPASVDPETGNVVLQPQKKGDPPDIFAPMLQNMGSSAVQLTQVAPPVALRKLAGSLVLEARERQQAKAH